MYHAVVRFSVFNSCVPGLLVVLNSESSRLILLRSKIAILAYIHLKTAKASPEIILCNINSQVKIHLGLSNLKEHVSTYLNFSPSFSIMQTTKQPIRNHHDALSIIQPKTLGHLYHWRGKISNTTAPVYRENICV